MYADRLVLCSDGRKLAKEGERMPGVKCQCQGSETVSKPESMFGHLFGRVGVLVGVPGECHYVSMQCPPNTQDASRSECLRQDLWVWWRGVACTDPTT